MKPTCKFKFNKKRQEENNVGDRFSLDADFHCKYSPFLCQPGRDHHNPLKPCTSSHSRQKWRELLFPLWSLALEASQGQTHCYRCHIDEAPSVQLVCSPAQTSADNLSWVALRRERLSCCVCKCIKGLKRTICRGWYLNCCGTFCTHMFVIHVYDLEGLGCKQVTTWELFGRYDKTRIFFKCWNQYLRIITNMRALESYVLLFV